MKLDPKGLEAAFLQWRCLCPAGTKEEALSSMEEIIAAYLKATDSAIVPVKPTQAMIQDGACSYDYPSAYMGWPTSRGLRAATAIYRAMIQAAQDQDQ